MKGLRLVARALLSLAALSGCGSSTTARSNVSSGFGHFAGYVRHGRLTALSASWSVPRVLGGSGVAATWIAAEGPGGRAFIQIGTNEESRAGSALPDYFAFWTDKAQHFRAIVLFEVHAGDQISASLKLVHSRWRLELLDESSSARRVFDKYEEGRMSFDEAQWLQEDVTDGKTGHVFAYPHVSPVVFRRLAVDSRAPSYLSVRSAWMSVGPANFAPGPLRDDAFTIEPVNITSVGKQYLRIAKGADDATRELEARASTWTSQTPRTKVLADVERFTRLLARNAHELADAHWPERVHALVRELIQEAKSTVQSLTVAVRRRHPREQVPAVLRQSTAGTTSIMIRRALHVPEDIP